MSRRKHARTQLNNSLSDVAASLSIDPTSMNFATGGSTLSSYGTVAYSQNYSLLTLNRIILTYMYANLGLFQTAIQLPIQDGLAKGIKIESGQLQPEDVDEILDWFEQNDVWKHLEDYWSWVRLYGGAAIIINCDQDPEKPINKRRLIKAPIEFYDVDRWQLSITGAEQPDYLTYDDMTDSDTFYLNGQKLDRSHLIIGSGKRAPSYIRRQLRGWGMSEGERMIRDLNNYLKTDDVLYEILDESKIDIYHIKDLANRMLTRGGTDAITKRIQLANQMKNYVSALVLDQDEQFESRSMTFTGLADVKRENRIGVASALRMPMTKLFGLSASGFSTGESDLDNYNQMVESEIQLKMKPAIRQCIEIACYNLWGYCPEFRFSFPKLKETPELEAAQIKESRGNFFTSLYDRGLFPAKNIADEMAKEEIISSELAKNVIENPVPPNGAESVMPVQQDNGLNKIQIMKNSIKDMVTSAMHKTGR